MAFLNSISARSFSHFSFWISFCSTITDPWLPFGGGQYGLFSSELDFACAKRSWRDPTGGSPVQVTGSTGLVASVALWKATATAKRTQQSCGVCMEPRNQLIAGA